MNTCGSVKRYGSESRRLRELLRMSGVTRRDIDRGVLRSDFHNNRSKPIPMPGTRGNGTLEPGEIYAAAIEKLETEEEGFAHSGGKSPRPFTDLVAACSTFRVPWIFSNFTGNDAEDRQVISYLMGEIDAIKNRIRGTRPDSIAYRKSLLDGIVQWLEGMLDRRDFVLGERTNMQMLKGVPGDCTENARFAYAVLRLAGFKPEYILVHENMRGKKIYHVCVGVPLDPRRPNRLVQVDLSYNGFSARGRRHRIWHRVPNNTMLAMFENNRGWHFKTLRDHLIQVARGTPRARPTTPRAVLDAFVARTSRIMAESVASYMVNRYERSIAYDPYFAEPYANKAWTLFMMGRRDSMVHFLARRAVDLNPHIRETRDLLKRLKGL